MNYVGGRLAPEDWLKYRYAGEGGDQAEHACDMAEYAFIAGHDPLWRFAEVRYVHRYTILGVPVEIATNAQAISDLAEHIFGRWPHSSTENSPRVRLRVFLQEAPERFQPSVDAPIYRMQGPYFMLVAGSSIAFADISTGFGAGFVTRELMADPQFVQIAILECLALYLVYRHHQAALHAAAVISEGRCVLLTGDCGAGKSTLACACVSAGMGLVSDDTVYVEPGGDSVVVWGNPWFLHVPPDTCRLFPHLADAAPIRELSGEVKCLIDVEALWPGAAQPRTTVDAVLTVGRSAGATSQVLPTDVAAVRDTLAHFRHGVSHDEAEAMLTAADRMLGLRLGHLEVGTDLRQAVDTIRNWLAE